MTSAQVQKVAKRKAYLPARRWHVPDSLRRILLASTLVAVAVFVLALVILSPLALEQLSSLHGVHWPQLSNIGQTYGAASALLTGLALIGVVGSMVFQIRAIRVSREQAAREQHAHLIEMALTDPIYQRAWGGMHDFYDSTDMYRQHGYINLIVSFWQNDYLLGGFSEHALRGVLSSFFRGEAGRNFWADTRDLRLQESEGRRDRRFCQIVEEEYRKAVATGPPAIKADLSLSGAAADQQVTTRNPVRKEAIMLALGVIGGIAFDSLIRRRSR